MCRAGPLIDTRRDPELVSSDNHECTWCEAQCVRSCMPSCNARQLDQRFCVQVCCVRSVATVATELIAMGITSKQNHSSRAAPGTLRTVCCSSAQCSCVRLPGSESQSAEAPCWQQLSGSAATIARCLVHRSFGHADILYSACHGSVSCMRAGQSVSGWTRPCAIVGLDCRQASLPGLRGPAPLNSLSTSTVEAPAIPRAPLQVYPTICCVQVASALQCRRATLHCNCPVSAVI
jgi:hypothetical protein